MWITKAKVADDASDTAGELSMYIILRKGFRQILHQKETALSQTSHRRPNTLSPQNNPITDSRQTVHIESVPELSMLACKSMLCCATLFTNKAEVTATACIPGTGHQARAQSSSRAGPLPGACSDQMHCSIHSRLMVCSIPILMIVPACSRKSIEMFSNGQPSRAQHEV